MATKPILIHIVQNQIEVEPRCQCLRRLTEDGVIFVAAPPSLQFKVIFSNSPFTLSQFDNSTLESGPAIVAESGDGKDQYFPYRVEVKGYESLDPGIIVW